MPVRPSGPYGIAKCLGEAAARYFSDNFGMSCICLRPGTRVGALRQQRPPEPHVRRNEADAAVAAPSRNGSRR